MQKTLEAIFWSHVAFLVLPEAFGKTNEAAFLKTGCVRGQDDQKREMQFASFEDLIWFWSSALALRHSSILETSWATFALTFIKTILVSICPLTVAWGLCQNQRGRTSSDVWAACVRGPPSVSWLRIFHPYSCTFLSPPWKYHLANKCTTLICTKLGRLLDK